MAIDFNLLNPSFNLQVQALLNKCVDYDSEMRPFYGVRSLIDQAKLWRQSRPTSEVLKKLDELNQEGCSYLAHIMVIAGPQNGKWATNAIPGLSWHNWGQAVDCFRVIKGNASWDPKDYQKYGELATAAGLKWGGAFSTPDYVHIQSPSKEVLDIYSLKQVNDYFEKLGTL